jgi:diguanylate cyclase
LEANFVETAQELDKIRDSLKVAEQRSNTDALTGLANRRSLEEFFRSAQIAARETGAPLSILMIDIAPGTEGPHSLPFSWEPRWECWS